MYLDHDPRSIAMFRVRRPNYLRIMISSSNQTSRRGIPRMNRELKIDDPRLTYPVPRTYVPVSLMSVAAQHDCIDEVGVCGVVGARIVRCRGG